MVGNSSYNELLARLTTADMAPAEPAAAATAAVPGEAAERVIPQSLTPGAGAEEVSGCEPSPFNCQSRVVLHNLCSAPEPTPQMQWSMPSSCHSVNVCPSSAAQFLSGRGMTRALLLIRVSSGAQPAVAAPRRATRAQELALEEAAGREDSFDRNLRAALALSLGEEPPVHAHMPQSDPAGGPCATREPCLHPTSPD